MPIFFTSGLPLSPRLASSFSTSFILTPLLPITPPPARLPQLLSLLQLSLLPHYREKLLLKCLHCMRPSPALEKAKDIVLVPYVIEIEQKLKQGVVLEPSLL